MGYIGGVLQERFTEQVRGVDPGRLLAVPIDVGKHSAVAMVCDFYGEIVTEPFAFALTAPGVGALGVAVARAQAARDAAWVRVGLEEAGHYHRTLLWRLRCSGMEVALLNPAQVKENRAQQLLRSLKSDARDLGAMAELLIRGRGRPAPGHDAALLRQAALTSHRRRKVKARSALKNHIHASLDLVFPGLSGCFDDILDTKFGRLLVVEGLDPHRVRRLGAERLRTFCAHRGVRVQRPKAHQVLEAARVAITLQPEVAAVHARVLAADVALLGALDEATSQAEAELEEILPHTPAGILTTIPRVSVIRASNYGGALGDPTRFRTSAQVYRMAGLVPRQYESAGKRRVRTTISREGKAELREAIIELGRALRQGHPDFARYAQQLEARGKQPGTVACALGHRANRVAFAMVREIRCPSSPSAGGSPSRRRARHDRASSTRPTSPAEDSLPSCGRRGDRQKEQGSGRTSERLGSPTGTPQLA
jgi:transposase